jgi:hypothetical protein
MVEPDEPEPDRVPIVLRGMFRRSESWVCESFFADEPRADAADVSVVFSPVRMIWSTFSFGWEDMS